MRVSPVTQMTLNPPEVPQLQLPGHTARSIIATTIHLLLQCLSWYIQRTYYRILTITDITGLDCIGLHWIALHCIALDCIGLQASLKNLRRESSAGAREVDLAQ